jgi:hypothetical protein
MGKLVRQPKATGQKREEEEDVAGVLLLLSEN